MLLATSLIDCFSCSMLFISRSQVFLDSLEARRNSAIPFPIERPNSGSFFGPRISSAKTKINHLGSAKRTHLLLSYLSIVANPG